MQTAQQSLKQEIDRLSSSGTSRAEAIAMLTRTLVELLQTPEVSHLAPQVEAVHICLLRTLDETRRKFSQAPAVDLISLALALDTVTQYHRRTQAD